VRHIALTRYDRNMSSSGAQPSVTEEAPGLFRVPGWSRAELVRALALYGVATDLQAEEAATRRPALLQAMLLAGFDPLPKATVEQARHLAQHRDRLVASGPYTITALRELRGDRSLSATRTWLSRQRARHALFTVEQAGTLLPSFELRVDGSPRPGVQPALARLVESGLDGWARWTWFTAGSPWLGGRAPLDLLDEQPDLVARAARSFVSNLA
jgi:hypothetical protein